MINFIFKTIVIKCIELYQKLAPERIRNSCCFEPTCSVYAIQAIHKYGVLRGILLAIKRLLRCKPANAGIDKLL